MPGMPRRSRTCAERDLEVLQDGDEAVDRAEVAAHRRHGLGEPVGVEAVVDAPVPGGGQAHGGGNASIGSLLIRPTWAPGTWATASTKRAVASSAYGATNTTFAIAAGR